MISFLPYMHCDVWKNMEHTKATLFFASLPHADEVMELVGSFFFLDRYALRFHHNWPFQFPPTLSKLCSIISLSPETNRYLAYFNLIFGVPYSVYKTKISG
jgi:hypothetical protein